MMTQREVVVARYCAERTIERRNAVVDAHRHLCSRGARKFKRTHNDRADLEQVAAVGLIKAAQLYRPEMRTPFQAYAWIMIVGELMHWVRDHERIVRAPRALRTLERRYAQAWDAFADTHHREPTAKELALVLAVPVQTVLELRALRCTAHVPLPDPDAADDPVAEALAHADRGIALDERVALALAVDTLSDRERTVVLATYGADLTQAEIGALLGLSQSSVSKLLTRALTVLAHRVA